MLMGLAVFLNAVVLLVGCGNGRHYFYLGRKVVGTMNYNNFGVSHHGTVENMKWKLVLTKSVL